MKADEGSEVLSHFWVIHLLDCHNCYESYVPVFLTLQTKANLFQQQERV